MAIETTPVSSTGQITKGTTSAVPATEAALRALLSGGSLEARVLATVLDGTLRLATRLGTLEARLTRGAETPPEGTLVTLSVDATETSSGETLLKAQVAPQEARAAVAGQAAEGSPARAIQTAVASALASQEGLTAAFDGAEALVVAGNAVPTPVRQASLRLLQSRTRLEQAATPQGLVQSVRASGVFLEAQLARTGSVPARDLKAALIGLKSSLVAEIGLPPAPPTAVEPAPLATGPRPDGSRVRSTYGPPPLPVGPSPPEAAPAEPSVPLPPVVPAVVTEDIAPPVVPNERAAAAPLPMDPGTADRPEPMAPPGAPVPTSKPEPTPSPVLPRQPGPVAAVPPSGDAPEIPSGRVPSDPLPVFPVAAPAVRSGPTRGDIAMVPAASLLSLQELAPPREGLAADRAAAPSAPARPGPAETGPHASPPLKGVWPAPEHRTVPPDLSALGEVDLMRRVLVDTDAALARVVLDQYASMPEEAGGARAPSGSEKTATPQWSFEVPVLVDGRTETLRFQVDKDGGGKGGRGGQGAQPSWRLRLAFDIEPLGPIRAQIGLIGGRLAIGLWADRAPTVAALSAFSGDLRAALTAADFAVDEIHLAEGLPPDLTPRASGVFVERMA